MAKTIADTVVEAANNGITGQAAVIDALNEAGVNTNTKPAVVAAAMPTGSAGGIANGAYQTVSAATAASTDISAASLTSTNLAIDALKNNFQELNVTVTAILAALKA